MFYVYWIYFWEDQNIYDSGYVGITDDLKDRFYKHRKRFGNFKFMIVFTGNKEQAFALEHHLRPKPNVGLNKAIGGLQFGVYSPMTGRSHSHETIEKIRSSNLGQKRSPETCEKLRNRRFSDEFKEKIRVSSSARRHRPESKAKVSEALRNRVRKPETFAKISEAKKKYYENKRNSLILNGTPVTNHHLVETLAVVDAEGGE